MSPGDLEPTDVCTSDVVVVGSGLAGLAAALYADRLTVTVLSKSQFAGGGSSVYAQGGVAVAMGSDDSPAQHAADTIACGCGLTDPEVAAIVTREGPGRIGELLRLGARLDRETTGELALGREAAHSRRRVAHASGDATGSELVRALANGVSASERISLQEWVFAEDLALADGGVAGVYAVDATGRRVLFRAPAVVLATGGIGQVFQHTTNPAEATGDGLALAARAGARLRDLEFVQFHPTALADGSDPMALLTEALRGEGARLVDETGTRFMTDIHPAAELAPRDVVARAIWRHQEAGHRVLLDATGIGDRFGRRFPTVLGLCRERGLDPTTEPIPVAPAAHYHMGGIEVDHHGRASVPGLWACGEVSCTGLHGANRLASNSLLEALVFGARVGETVSATLRPSSGHSDRCRPAADPAEATGDHPWRGSSATRAALRTRLRSTMWRAAGVERTGSGLAGALEEILELADSTSTHGELRNLLTVARLVCTAAAARPESRGGHFRSDLSETDPAWQRHLVFAGVDLVEPGATREEEPAPPTGGADTLTTGSAVVPLHPLQYVPLIERALREDLGRGGDLTTDAIIPVAARAEARVVARVDGRVAGIDVAAAVFRSLDEAVATTTRVRDGLDAAAGDTLLVVRGPARAVLTAERTALNLLARMCGVATLTRAFVRAVAGTRARVVGTRKTTPGLRALQKYAVRCGGGANHRFGLDDAVLVKDNHIAAAGGITPAVERVRAAVGHTVKVEVEVDTLAQLEEVLRLGVDAVLLDNMTVEQLREAVAMVAGRAMTEASGGITLETAAAVAATGVDLLSVGALTHSAPALDVSLEFD